MSESIFKYLPDCRKYSMNVPREFWTALLLQSGCRSKKYRIRKKMIKKQFLKNLRDLLNEI